LRFAETVEIDSFSGTFVGGGEVVRFPVSRFHAVRTAIAAATGFRLPSRAEKGRAGSHEKPFDRRLVRHARRIMGRSSPPAPFRETFHRSGNDSEKLRSISWLRRGVETPRR